MPAYPGAKLFAYAAGTTTKQNTYTSVTLVTPNANPVVADANGLFGSIYLDPALSYKFVLAPSTDTDPPASPIYTQDNANAASTQSLSVLSKGVDYTVSASDGDDVIILCDSTFAPFTVTIYTAVGNAGRKVRVVKVDSSANTVTIDPTGAQTWSGVTSKVLALQWDSSSAVADGANWVEFGATVSWPRVVAYHNTTQSLTDVTETALSLNSEDLDVGAMHSTSSNTSRLTVPTGQGGFYEASGYASFADSAVGYRLVMIRKNGTTALEYALTAPAAGNLMRVLVSWKGVLAAADYLELVGYQNTGGALNSGSATRALGNMFSLRRIG